MSTTEHTTRDLWGKTIDQIPNPFARLVYLASLRNPETGHYEYWPMAQVVDEETVDRILDESHQRALEVWLSLGLEEQKICLDSYLSVAAQDRQAAVVETWISKALPDDFVPRSAWDVERQLYALDLGVLLNLMHAEGDATTKAA